MIVRELLVCDVTYDSSYYSASFLSISFLWVCHCLPSSVPFPHPPYSSFFLSVTFHIALATIWFYTYQKKATSGYSQWWHEGVF
jgi:hypothetical protein